MCRLAGNCTRFREPPQVYPVFHFAPTHHVDLKIIHIEVDVPGSDKENPNREWIKMSNQRGKIGATAGYTVQERLICPLGRRTWWVFLKCHSEAGG
jgi:hypothetical protein